MSMSAEEWHRLADERSAEIVRLRRAMGESEAARAADRREWIEHMRSFGPMLRQAKEDGTLDALIEANFWPLPKCAITDADVQKSIEIARRIRPQIEAE
jgi:glutamine synthetase type III